MRDLFGIIYKVCICNNYLIISINILVNLKIFFITFVISVDFYIDCYIGEKKGCHPGERDATSLLLITLVKIKKQNEAEQNWCSSETGVPPK